MASGYVLKVEHMGFAERWDVGFEVEKNKRVKNGSKMCGVGKQKDGSNSEMVKMGKEVCIGEQS